VFSYERGTPVIESLVYFAASNAQEKGRYAISGMKTMLEIVGIIVNICYVQRLNRTSQRERTPYKVNSPGWKVDFGSFQVISFRHTTESLVYLEAFNA
jgi:hypothetical protein